MHASCSVYSIDGSLSQRRQVGVAVGHSLRPERVDRLNTALWRYERISRKTPKAPLGAWRLKTRKICKIPDKYPMEIGIFSPDNCIIDVDH